MDMYFYVFSASVELKSPVILILSARVMRWNLSLRYSSPVPLVSLFHTILNHFFLPVPPPPNPIPCYHGRAQEMRTWASALSLTSFVWFVLSLFFSFSSPVPSVQSLLSLPLLWSQLWQFLLQPPLNACCQLDPFWITHPGHYSAFRIHPFLSPNILNFISSCTVFHCQPTPLILLFFTLVFLPVVLLHSSPLPLPPTLVLLQTFEYYI